MISKMHHPLPIGWTLGVLALLCLFPLAANALGMEFYIGFGARLLILALVATSLNLILGFGGMVSLGHAAYFGAGAYTVGILMHHGIMPAAISWPLAVLVSAVLAFLIGLICLRTKGVYFIMITLAFAQMIYYVFVSLTAYGGDDGITLSQRSEFFLDLSSDTTFYYVVLLVFAACMYLVYRLVNSRFGRVVQAISENETRMEAIGYPVFRYKLVCFMIAGALAGLGGALFANQMYMANPSMLHWMQSGTLMVMVILGGVGYLFGGVIGAVFMLLLEEILASYTLHWALFVGFILLAIVLYLPQGLSSVFSRRKLAGEKA